MKQTEDHLMTSCPIYCHPDEARGIASNGVTLENWLMNPSHAQLFNLGFLKEKLNPYDEEEVDLRPAVLAESSFLWANFRFSWTFVAHCKTDGSEGPRNRKF